MLSAHLRMYALSAIQRKGHKRKKEALRKAEQLTVRLRTRRSHILRWAARAHNLYEIRSAFLRSPQFYESVSCQKTASGYLNYLFCSFADAVFIFPISHFLDVLNVGDLSVQLLYESSVWFSPQISSTSTPYGKNTPSLGASPSNTFPYMGIGSTALCSLMLQMTRIVSFPNVRS